MSKKHIAIVADLLEFKAFKKGIRKNWPEIYKIGNDNTFEAGELIFIRISDAQNNLIEAYKWAAYYELMNWEKILFPLMVVSKRLNELEVKCLKAAELYKLFQDEYEPIF